LKFNKDIQLLQNFGLYNDLEVLEIEFESETMSSEEIEEAINMWEVIDQTEDTIEIEIEFADPLLISASSESQD
jgi:hypothetical protein